MKVVGMDHIVLRVKDQEAALRFYSHVLGLEKLRTKEWREGKAPFPSVRVSEATIIDLMRLREEAPSGSLSRNLDHFCLAVAPQDWGKLLAELQARGITPQEAPRPRWGARGTGTSVYIQDPDGNTLELKSYP